VPVGTELDMAAVEEAARSSVSQVFSMMLQSEPSPRPSFQVEEMTPTDGVVALLTYSGDWVGAGIFCCTDQTARNIGSRMLMEELTQMNSEVLDGVGEIANMVLGGIKEQLLPLTGPLALSIPTVVYGKNFVARAGVRAPWIVFPFQESGAIFEVRLCLQRR